MNIINAPITVNTPIIISSKVFIFIYMYLLTLMDFNTINVVILKITGPINTGHIILTINKYKHI